MITFQHQEFQTHDTRTNEERRGLEILKFQCYFDVTLDWKDLISGWNSLKPDPKEHSDRACLKMKPPHLQEPIMTQTVAKGQERSSTTILTTLALSLKSIEQVIWSIYRVWLTYMYLGGGGVVEVALLNFIEKRTIFENNYE